MKRITTDPIKGLFEEVAPTTVTIPEPRNVRLAWRHLEASDGYGREPTVYVPRSIRSGAWIHRSMAAAIDAAGGQLVIGEPPSKLIVRGPQQVGVFEVSSPASSVVFGADETAPEIGVETGREWTPAATGLTALDRAARERFDPPAGPAAVADCLRSVTGLGPAYLLVVSAAAGSEPATREDVVDLLAGLDVRWPTSEPAERVAAVIDRLETSEVLETEGGLSLTISVGDEQEYRRKAGRIASQSVPPEPPESPSEMPGHTAGRS